MSQDNHETPRTFTQAQSHTMYETLQRIERDAPKTKTVHRQHLYEVVSNFYYAGCYIRETLQAIASQPAPQAGRYSVTTGEYGEYGASVAIYVIYDNVRGRHLDGAYRDEAEANAAARELNASEQGGDNS